MLPSFLGYQQELQRSCLAGDAVRFRGFYEQDNGCSAGGGGVWDDTADLGD